MASAIAVWLGFKIKAVSYESSIGTLASLRRLWLSSSLTTAAAMFLMLLAKSAKEMPLHDRGMDWPNNIVRRR